MFKGRPTTRTPSGNTTSSGGRAGAGVTCTNVGWAGGIAVFRLQYHNVHGRTPCRRANRAWTRHSCATAPPAGSSVPHEISEAVQRLPKKDLVRFRKWFAEYDAAAWDQQLERDGAAGRLEAFAPRGSTGDEGWSRQGTVTHRATSRFWRCYHALPATVQELADRRFALLKTEPSHSSLHFKKIGQPYSARVGLHYRALAIESGGDMAWFRIGSHTH